MRVRVDVPQALIAEVERVAGKSRRSRFIEAAIREKLAREQLAAALASTAGVLSAADYPEWETPEQISAWVESSRQADSARLGDKLPTTDA